MSRRNQHDDFTYNRLEELAKVQGKATIPPRLGNLVKCLPEWRQIQKERDQERSEKEQAADHVPGAGRITNWTQQRLKGEAPPLVYTRMETSAARSRPMKGNGLSKVTFSDLQLLQSANTIIKQGGFVIIHCCMLAINRAFSKQADSNELYRNCLM